MGISVGKMLDGDFFKDYKVLAGHGGLNNQIQGFAMLDAPDGFLWTKGREFAMSSGYVLEQNPGLFEQIVHTENFKKIACFGLKVDRYLKAVPESILNTFNELNIPLLYIPSKDSWMDIMNAINVMVMNKNIIQFNIGEINSSNFNDLSYNVRKINKILGAVEYEMNFPAMVYDLSTETPYYSSPNFKKVSNGLKNEDFWNPSFNFSKEILCDSLKMARYRFYDNRYEKPFSWITVPITVDGKVKAYFVVLEAIDLIDYFDQFSIRTGFLLIQELYEQLLAARNIVDSDFEKFIKSILNGNLNNREEIASASNEINLKINSKYFVLVMKQDNDNITLSGYHDVLKNCIRDEFFYNDCRVSYIENNKCLFLIKLDDNMSEKQTIDLIREKSLNIKKRLELVIHDIGLNFGLSDTSDFIYNINRNYIRANQAINMGSLLYNSDEFWTYSQLGAFAWLDVKDDEIKFMMKDFEFLLSSEEHKELVITLKAYLECKMNYSLTAKKLFVHINTVRKRIEEITDLIKLDLDDPINRLKLEIILKLFV